MFDLFVPGLHRGRVPDMPIADAVGMLERARHDEAFRDALCEREFAARRTYLMDQGYDFEMGDFQCAVQELLMQCRVPEEAGDLQALAQWFYVLHYVD